MTRLLLVEDRRALRPSMAFVLDLEPDHEVVAQAGSVEEARGHLEGIDVALAIIDLPGAKGVELVRPTSITGEGTARSC